MEPSRSGARLIIVCGLPGSGKTTFAKTLESKLYAIRFCPDEWMEALGIDIYDEQRRAKIEALQWQIATTARAQPHRHHRMGHLGKIGAERAAPRGPGIRRCR